ncbi:MAG: PleD family two-component system response regulator [Sulfuricellaceae bacterium]
MKILVAEKDHNGRRLLHQMLRMEGHEVLVADGGDEAVTLLRRFKPDVVLMNMFGSLHAEDRPAGQISLHCGEEVSPVILMTSSGACDMLADFMPAGADPEAEFDRLPAQAKISAMEHIQRLCGALSRCKRVSEHERGLRHASSSRGKVDHYA